MNPEILRRYRRHRSTDPYQPPRAVDALRIAQHEVSADTDTRFPFLGKLTDYPVTYPDTTPDTVTGEWNGFTICVEVDHDQDWSLGDDDVTGTFSDTWAPGAISNTRPGDNGGSFRYYHPSNSRNQEIAEADKWWHGMSRGVRNDYAAWLVRADMADDSTRTYYAVYVRVLHDGQELATAGLGGIDAVEGDDLRPYLVEAAGDTINEALSQVKDQATDLVRAAYGRAETLAAAIGALLQEDEL